MIMNHHNLRITAQNQPTVLERLLQVTRYRGFTVTEFTMSPADNDTALAIEMSVQSTHPITQLYQQLNKLIDIDTIDVSETAAQLCQA